jgi:hypothetical protein
VYLHKYEARLAKDISTLQAEAEMLGPEGRNKYGENREHITAELALLKKFAGMIEEYNKKAMREAIKRMERLNREGGQ